METIGTTQGVSGLGFRGLGVSGLGFRGLGVSGLGFRGLGFRGLGFRVNHTTQRLQNPLLT